MRPTALPPLAVALAVAASPCLGASLPAGFSEERLTNGLDSPTAMEIAADGRIFVCEKGGALRVIENGALLDTPFLTVNVNSAGERGLLGVAFDPDFDVNGYVYVYYTATTPAIHNRVSRFVANGDVAADGSEQVLFDLDPLSSATNHNGGAIHFGPDGKLYVAVGENANGANSQSLDTVLGKVLRLDPNGGIPLDNPFFAVTSGKNRAIWALGLRNPFTFAFHRASGRMFIDDVGQDTWEEIDDGIAGSNYGWPSHEGIAHAAGFRDPLFAYSHGSGCAITGGAFYDPVTGQFPAAYLGTYFFADYCGGTIRRYNPATGTATSFASGISSPVDLKVSPDGTLYYLATGSGSLFAVRYTGSGAPHVTTQPQSLTVAVGQPAAFVVTATGTAPLAYRWRRNGADIPGATASTYSIPATLLSDDGAALSVVVSNSLGSDTSGDAVLTVLNDTLPVVAIDQPAPGTSYAGGDTIDYAGTAADAEDGTLGGSAFTWWIDFHHGSHTHPFLAPTTGATSGSFTIPTLGETSPDVWYRIHLRVTDSAGLSQESLRDVLPRTSTLGLSSDPPGLKLTLDGQPAVNPSTFVGVEGMVRTLGAATPQKLGGRLWVFSSWSDAGDATHAISTPSADTTYTATFVQNPPGALQFGAPTFRRVESARYASLVVRRVGGATGTVSITYATVDGTAVAGEDYAATTGQLTFAPGVASRAIRVPLLDDSIVEGDETFGVTLSQPTGGGLLGFPASAEVTIVDDDHPGAVSFAAASFVTSESAPSATIRVTRTGGAASGVTVDYATGGGSATPGADYTATGGTLSFGAGVLSATFSIPILEDDLAEGTEAVDLALSNPTGGSTLGKRPTSQLRITDDDRGGSLAFRAGSAVVDEALGTATVTVQRTGGLAGGVTVDYATADGTATEGADYTAATGTLTFDAGITTRTFTVTILDDAVHEPNERILLSLLNPSGGGRLGVLKKAVLVIRDDDP